MDHETVSFMGLKPLKDLAALNFAILAPSGKAALWKLQEEGPSRCFNPSWAVSKYSFDVEPTYVKPHISKQLYISIRQSILWREVVNYFGYKPLHFGGVYFIAMNHRKTWYA